MPDPVSWFLIERGWRVLDREGGKVGEVEETIGDSTHDVFDGLSIATSFAGPPRYVPSEQVGAIEEGFVHLQLSREEVAGLAEYKEPPTTAEIEPEKAGLLTRAEAKVEAPIHTHPERENVLRRFWLRLTGRLRR